MITYAELANDPWPTYPVDKEELRELLHYREIYEARDLVDPDQIVVTYIAELPDGSANCEFVVGRNCVQKLIKEGLITVLKKAAEDVEVESE
jgi:hypothetical protein